MQLYDALFLACFLAMAWILMNGDDGGSRSRLRVGAAA